MVATGAKPTRVSPWVLSSRFSATICAFLPTISQLMNVDSCWVLYLDHQMPRKHTVGGQRPHPMFIVAQGASTQSLELSLQGRGWPLHAYVGVLINLIY